MTNATQHLARFDGGNALPGFRAKALTARLEGVAARVAGVEARFVHWVWSDAPLTPASRERLAELLRYVATHDFVPFAWYRIAFGIVVLVTAATGMVTWAA